MTCPMKRGTLFSIPSIFWKQPPFCSLWSKTTQQRKIFRSARVMRKLCLIHSFLDVGQLPGARQVLDTRLSYRRPSRFSGAGNSYVWFQELATAGKLTSDMLSSGRCKQGRVTGTLALQQTWPHAGLQGLPGALMSHSLAVSSAHRRECFRKATGFQKENGGSSTKDLDMQRSTKCSSFRS